MGTSSKFRMRLNLQKIKKIGFIAALLMSPPSFADDSRLWTGPTLGGPGIIGSLDVECRIIAGFALRLGAGPYMFVKQPVPPIIDGLARDRKVGPFLLLAKQFGFNETNQVFVGAGILLAIDNYHPGTYLNPLFIAGYRHQMEIWYLDFGIHLALDAGWQLAPFPAAILPFVGIGFKLF